MSQYFLDTDTLTLFQFGHPVVCQRAISVPDTDIFVTIISVEEQLSGWYTALRQAKQPDQIAAVYVRMTEAVRFLAGRQIVTYTQVAMQRYDYLVTLRLNIGKMDQRIAAIALEEGATLVTRNTRDFGRVPGLTIEDWSV